MINRMNEEQQKAFLEWSTGIVESIKSLHKEVIELSDMVMKHRKFNMEQSQKVADLFMALGKHTGAMTEKEVNELKGEYYGKSKSNV